MTRDQVGADRPLTAVFEERLRAYALRVLRDTLEWQLTEAQWSPIAAAVGMLVEALHSGNVDAFKDAVNRLATGVVREATGFGDVPTVPAPEQVRDQIYELIHTIDGLADTQE